LYNPELVQQINIRQSDYYLNYYTTNLLGSRQEQYNTNVYAQQNVEVIPNRLTLVGSLAHFYYFQESENNVSPLPPTTITGSVQRQSKILHRVGAVFNLTKDIALYALDSTTMQVQTSRQIDGSYTDPQLGIGREIGVKTNLVDGRLGMTVAIFDIKLTNVAFSPGLISPITGLSYVVPIGATKQKGADITLFAKPLTNWQVTFNAYKGTVKDAFGNAHLGGTYTGTWSFYTRYDFTSDALKQFAIGGGAYRTYGRWSASNPNFVLPDGNTPGTNGSPNGARVIRLADGTMSSLFVDYKFNRHLTLKLTVNNVLDQRFDLGALNVFQPNPAIPRTFGMIATYRF